MATAFWKKDPRGNRKPVLIAKWRAADGSQKPERLPNVRTLRQALDYARDREHEADQVRKGHAVEARSVTFGELWDEWWNREGKRRRSDSKFSLKSSLEKHLADLRTFSMTPGTAGTFAERLETVLNAREDASELGPESLNRLRGAVHRMFEHARDPKVALWRGENPVRWVTRRKVPRSRKETLAHHEVQPVLDAFPEPRLGAPWRWAAAVSLYAGARPGEAFGLRRSDVDLEGGSMVLRYSWNAPMPKDEEPRRVVIVPELRAHLEAALKTSAGELVFPRADGSPFAETTRFGLIDHLRRALVKAKLLVGFAHVCRRCKGKVSRGELPKGTPHTWPHQDGAQRACENVVEGKACGMKLWAKPLPRPLRLYDLRHTHATLLRRSGVDLGTVQKAMGHSDPRITASTYDHSELEERRGEFEQALTFAVKTGAPLVREQETAHQAVAAAPVSAVAPHPWNMPPAGLEPAASSFGGAGGEPAPSDTGRTEAHTFDVSATSERLSAALAAQNARTVTQIGGAGGAPASGLFKNVQVPARLPSAVPSFLEACANLAAKAAERGDFAKAVELMQKAARVAALREEAA